MILNVVLADLSGNYQDNECFKSLLNMARTYFILRTSYPLQKCCRKQGF